MGIIDNRKLRHVVKSIFSVVWTEKNNNMYVVINGVFEHTISRGTIWCFLQKIVRVLTKERFTRFGCLVEKQ